MFQRIMKRIQEKYRFKGKLDKISSVHRIPIIYEANGSELKANIEA